MAEEDAELLTSSLCLRMPRAKPLNAKKHDHTRQQLACAQHPRSVPAHRLRKDYQVFAGRDSATIFACQCLDFMYMKGHVL